MILAGALNPPSPYSTCKILPNECVTDNSVPAVAGQSKPWRWRC